MQKQNTYKNTTFYAGKSYYYKNQIKYGYSKSSADYDWYVVKLLQN